MVIVGAGAGASVARDLAEMSEGEVEILLVDPKEDFTTCFRSNLYLGGLRDFDSITHSHPTGAAIARFWRNRCARPGMSGSH